MPKIDFYILPETDAKTRSLFICRLIEKAYKQRHRIFIHTDNEAIGHQFDELLWTYREDSFLPHNIYGEGPEPAPPIQIGINATPDAHRDILINLSQNIPPFYKQFSRVLELINPDTTAQESGRERYRTYRANGCEMNTHKLQTIEN